jgi:hypothetical protein
MNKMLFLNLLSLVAPTLWVLVAGALGFSVGAWGPNLLKKFKNDSLTSTLNPSNAGKIPRRNAASRATNPSKRKKNPPSGGTRRKRSS